MECNKNELNHLNNEKFLETTKGDSFCGRKLSHYYSNLRAQG